MRNSPGLARLTAIRLSSQIGDGMFQAALSGAILFDPTRATHPLDVAAGFTVMLLPYSIIGPYAGSLLDRWDRRTVLLAATLVRLVLICLTAVGLLLAMGVRPLLVLALATVGVSRFVLSGISASVPHVVEPDALLRTNSVLVTVGSGCATLGAVIAVAVIRFTGGEEAAVALSALGSVLAAAATVGFARRALGPDDTRHHVVVNTVSTEPFSQLAAVRAIATGLRTGVAAVWRAPVVSAAMIGIAANRVVFGINTLIMVLVLRTPTQGGLLPSGLVGFGCAIGAAASGMLVAAITTPFLSPRIGRARLIFCGLVAGLLVQVSVVPALTPEMLLLGAGLLGWAGQTVKLSGDAAMQMDIDDTHRGRVFALQDTVFNITFVAALGLSALVVPADGRSLPLVVTGALVYGLGLLAVVANSAWGRKAACPNTFGGNSRSSACIR